MIGDIHNDLYVCVAKKITDATIKVEMQSTELCIPGYMEIYVQ